jgi:hypothetical protein
MVEAGYETVAREIINAHVARSTKVPFGEL